MIRAAALLLLFMVLFAREARAQDDIEVVARVSAEVVEVGEVFTLELSALSSEQIDFTSPELRLPDGLGASGPFVGPKLMAQLGAGGSMFRRGITAQWRVSARKTGSYTIAPPAVRARGRRFTAEGALRVTVVEPGQKPQQPNVFDPFGIHNDPFGDPLADLMEQMRKRRRNSLILDEPVENYDSLGPIGRRLALNRGDDEYIFLRVAPDKSRAVVGEQVTLVYYLYSRVKHEFSEYREPQLADFMRVPLDDEPGHGGRKLTAVGGRLWEVFELNRVAAFPLRAGTLHTGQLHAKLRIPYLRNQTVPRDSRDVTLEVREPPLDGRPAGYRIGDVGRFTLKAEVTPRQTVAGETVAVRIRVEGRGSLPNELKLPQRTGVEWLSPEKTDDIDVRDGRVGGSRVFGHAVRLTDEGDVDLGIVELPYYDPDAREYRVARAALGTVKVKPAAAAASNAPAPPDEIDPFATLAKHRMSLREYDPPSRRPLDPRWFWGLTATPPLAVVLFGALARVAAAIRRRRGEKRRAPSTLCREALGDMVHRRDGKEVAAAGERALHHAIEAACGLKSRGVLLEALARELQARGIDADLAKGVSEALDECATMRFQPAADEDAAELAKRIKRLAQELLDSEPEELPQAAQEMAG